MLYESNSYSVSETILVVDDDENLCTLLQRYLSEHGYQVKTVGDGVAMFEVLSQQSVDLIILDLMLPGEDGLQLARRLADHPAALLMLSARGEAVDRIIGLEMGADDYLAKPFNPRELLARIRALLRRGLRDPPSSSEGGGLTVGRFTLNLHRQELQFGATVITLTRTETVLLALLLRRAGEVVSRDELVQQMRGDHRQPNDRSIDVGVTRLRRKIEPDPAVPIFLRTVWGKGYRFTPEG